MHERVIKGDACVAEGAAWLAAAEPRFGAALRVLPPLPLRLKPDGFAELLSAIVSQQVSTAAAAAIWGRVADAGVTTPDRVRSMSDNDLRALGLSRPKVRYAKALAMAEVDYAALHNMPSNDVIKRLTAVTGIGVWTAEIYAMFSLGRADVFAHGDLALQEAAKVLFDLPERPTEKEMRVMATAWSPWRSVAARILWSYYRYDKGKEGVR
ncbi:MAG: DNA-3-methyladenine glycosylase 2 family protein [Pseudomonadota bacterium]